MTGPFRVVLAPDKFKGSLRADQVARTIRQVLEAASPEVEVLEHPVADGGEGTVDLAVTAGFDPVSVTVTGPLGEPVQARFALRGEVAVLEMASAAGLDLLPGAPDRDTAWNAGTYGVGELILAAVDRGATRVVVGAGGSATTDGGAGAVAALGVDLDALGRRGPSPRPEGLDPRLAHVDLVVACDVDNPLTGPDGAAAVYAPQKGADAELVAALEDRLTRWADTVAAGTGHDRRAEPGTGAAGGFAFGLVALAGARIASGVELLLDLTGFAEQVSSADLIVVGEGSLDSQSLRGKGPVGVARAVAEQGVAVVAVAGRNLLTREESEAAGLRAVYALSDIESDPEVSMRDADRLLGELSRVLAADWLPAPGSEPSGGPAPG